MTVKPEKNLAEVYTGHFLDRMLRPAKEKAERALSALPQVHYRPSLPSRLPPQKKGLTRILLPSGIGDIHWVMLKMRSFLESLGQKAEAWVFDTDGRPRSLDFIRRIPFVKAGGNYSTPDGFGMGQERDRFTRAYSGTSLDLVPGFLEFDYLMCFNGSLTSGIDLEKGILPGFKTEWDYPVTETPGDVATAKAFKKKHGRYVLLFLSEFSSLSRWVAAIGEEKLRQLLSTLKKKFPRKQIVLTGSPWDAPLNRRLSDLAVDMSGKTKLGPFLSLVRNADAFVGFPGGNTIVSTHFGTPTVILWHKTYPNLRFRSNWADPKKAGTLYRWMESEDYDEERLLDLVSRSMEAGGTL